MKKSPYIDSKEKKILSAGSPDLRAENEILKGIIKERLGMSEHELQKLLRPELPVSIFRSRSSALEVVVTYLHDVKAMRFSEIAATLNRDQRTIWHAYKRSTEKKTVLRVLDSDTSEIAILPKAERLRLAISDSAQEHAQRFSAAVLDITIPVSIFSDRTYAPLESVVAHLKDSHNLSFTEIAALLERSRKTVWTVYQRAKKKHER